ncbi:MAG: BlaI/MecI/CopY family transcriptional regulator [Sphingomonas sp.]|nr:BlaI/MecI/CopY family transcriptional regulator [Sphingomonas sp.]
MIDKLPARERQLFETLYAMKQASAAELVGALDNAPGNSAVRVMLRRLEAKGFVTHREENGRFIYSPAVPGKRLEQSALHRFVETYFGGSPLGAAAALIGMSEKVDPDELRQLEQMIAKVREEEGK